MKTVILLVVVSSFAVLACQFIWGYWCLRNRKYQYKQFINKKVEEKAILRHQRKHGGKHGR